MRGAAELVRDHCQSVDSPEHWIKSQTFRTMARIVWNQDHALAQSILERDVLVQTHLEIVNNKVMIEDFEIFTNESDTVNSIFGTAARRIFGNLEFAEQKQTTETKFGTC